MSVNTLTDQQKARKTIRLFGVASFLHDIGGDMVFSLWPLFLTTVLNASMTAVGVIDGLGDAIVSISQAASGYLSDRIKKRKVFVWIGYLLGGVARIGYAISPTWQVAIPFRVLDRSGKMRGSPRDAIISDLSTVKNRGGNFGILRAMDNAGAVVGITLAILLLGKFGFRNLFLLAAIPSFIGAMLLLFGYREQKPAETRPFERFQMALAPGRFKLYLILNMFFSLGSFSYSFLMLLAKQDGMAAVALPALYLVAVLTEAVFSYPFGQLADRIGRKIVLLMSFSFWVILLMLLYLAGGTISAIVVFVLYGLHKAALEPVQRAFGAELSPKKLLASSLGVLQMTVGLASLPASVIAGMLWDGFGPAAMLLFSVAMTVIAGGLLVLVKEEK